jgi:hypothetical protein
MMFNHKRPDSVQQQLGGAMIRISCTCRALLDTGIPVVLVLVEELGNERNQTGIQQLWQQKLSVIFQNFMFTQLL